MEFDLQDVFKDLQKRGYLIEEIISTLYDDEKKKSIKRNDWASITLATEEEGKILSWMFISIKKKEGKYYIVGIQISKNFPCAQIPDEY